MVTLAVVALGCGSSETGSPGPTVTDADLGGVYQLSALEVGGTSFDLSDPVEVVIDSEFGELQVETACSRLLGSYSLLADGQAGFTIAGGSTRDCSAEARSQQNELVAVLGRVSSWTASGSNLELTSPSSDRVLLDR